MRLFISAKRRAAGDSARGVAIGGTADRIERLSTTI
jgi:hypothetical protein